MKLDTKFALGGVFLLVSILGGWCSLAGFEEAWNRGRITMLDISNTELMLSIYSYGRDYYLDM